MQEIIKNLFLGNDIDHETAAEKGWPILVAAKDGPHGHRTELKYTGRSAPKGDEFYYVDRGNVRHLNLIDPDTAALIPKQVINAALEFIKKYQEEDVQILVHCNQGHSRGPSIILGYLRTIGEMPNGFLQSEKKFKTIYPPYDPKQGIQSFIQTNWRNLLWKGTTENDHERYSKEEVKYEDVAKGKDKCSGCINFQTPNGCEIVVGLIQPGGWCQKFEPKVDAKG